MSNWLNELKVGDYVVITQSLQAIDGIAKVERLTKTQIIATHGQKYRIEDGCLVGRSAYSQNKIIEAPDRRIENILFKRKVRDAVIYIDKIKANDLDDNKAIELSELIRDFLIENQ